ncbi:uncharacterized protein AMSG_08465 [Thecamonas trahens ATCC 50062]|uniref:Transmembrane protein n=1 Tax=Thecamonas trahens ATCC 50062 TaxID=461836 RepID=A0A0L0DK08_THETB|nr:hypothetical protein AMSG_08465 [Thecamonas trahens ATCC 50062]KNC52602.1 hypothetical protein AMSG_08465 [Thecamonas trahens ATCC 50062]|eukprot:XP_013755161.1 hypothetical protein AMSG_08465 [Thecamonas trahens ATCC 50062]
MQGGMAMVEDTVDGQESPDDGTVASSSRPTSFRSLTMGRSGFPGAALPDVLPFDAVYSKYTNYHAGAPPHEPASSYSDEDFDDLAQVMSEDSSSDFGSSLMHPTQQSGDDVPSVIVSGCGPSLRRRREAYVDEARPVLQVTYVTPRVVAPFALSRPPLSWKAWATLHALLLALAVALASNMAVSGVLGYIYRDASCDKPLAWWLRIYAYATGGAFFVTCSVIVGLSIADKRGWLQLPATRSDVGIAALMGAVSLVAGSWGAYVLIVVLATSHCSNTAELLYTTTLIGSIVAIAEALLGLATALFCVWKMWRPLALTPYVPIGGQS